MTPSRSTGLGVGRQPLPNRSGADRRRPSSDGPDVLRLFALAPRRNVELNALPLVQRLVARALDVGVMHEDVVAFVTSDETKALFGVEELNGTNGQIVLFS